MSKRTGSVVAAAVAICALVYAFIPRSGKRTEILLYCGAGIRPAADALIRAFEDTRPDIRVNASYGGSGRQVGQIESVRKGDIFMPGADFYVDMVLERDLAFEDTKRTVAYFVPVIFVQKGNPRNIESLEDLGKEELRVGLGDERSCAVGKLILKILEKNSIPYSKVERNVIYKSGTVNELGVAVRLRNVDAAVLWDVNARHFAEHGDIIPIPFEKNILSTIPVVMLKSSEHPDEAQAFIDFAASEKGGEILREKGYTVNPPSSRAVSDP